ncbi:ABC transporter permease [Enterovibrio norvegicus]|uniref:Sugar ABC transporter permease n=1 Tax=Enterovibrio norvegicus TaxID=188144 RepID=A0A2N7LFT1_9GAMM|nr:ABC transporter permease [Enterovibrio norvegicus]PML77314.1 sugar ABC transporter permease [Enterovibrio norvegicus]PMN70630.1 sugar ABC transporter permease [Enterovibrio norvegicus]PMN94251.1 sugar ABC transporter permease [Enterovibrio norvegicus]
MELFNWLLSSADSTLRLAVPLIFAAMAGIFSERAGVVDIGLEGKMLFSAFVAAAVSYVTGNPWLGLFAAILGSMLLSLIHGYASITQKGDQIISGLAVNFFASGMTITLGHAWFERGGQTPSLNSDQRFLPSELPGAEWLGETVPYLGPLYRDVISGHNILVYLAFVAAVVTWWVLFRTRFGLRLRAVGEEPNAIDTAGISVVWLRYRAVLIAGLLCGLAGAYLSTAQNAAFGKEMTAGQGYIALAAVIFGKWQPRNALLACLLFGFLSALETRMQGVDIPLIGVLPTQVFSALPYVLTVVLLAGFIGKAVAPKAIGRPYEKER